jgi:Methyltransferase domain
LSWIDALSLPPGARVLEVGCGPGHTAVELARRGFTVECTDSSTEMVALTSRRISEARVADAVAVSVDVHALPSSTGSFALVIALGVLRGGLTSGPVPAPLPGANRIRGPESSTGEVIKPAIRIRSRSPRTGLCAAPRTSPKPSTGSTRTASLRSDHFRRPGGVATQRPAKPRTEIGVSRSAMRNERPATSRPRSSRSARWRYSRSPAASRASAISRCARQ